MFEARLYPQVVPRVREGVLPLVLEEGGLGLLPVGAAVVAAVSQRALRPPPVIHHHLVPVRRLIIYSTNQSDDRERAEDRLARGLLTQPSEQLRALPVRRRLLPVAV